MFDKIEHALRAVSGVSDVLREVTRERDQLRVTLRRVEGERDECSEGAMELRAEIERLWINLRDYRQKHPCRHEVMCWANEAAWKALGSDKEC